MTREEIDQVLAGIVAAETTGNRFAKGGAITTGLGMLAEIVADQEHRLRVLEPCRDGEVEGVHLWCATTDDGPLVCVHCRITKEPPR